MRPRMSAEEVHTYRHSAIADESMLREPDALANKDFQFLTKYLPRKLNRRRTGSTGLDRPPRG